MTDSVTPDVEPRQPVATEPLPDLYRLMGHLEVMQERIAERVAELIIAYRKSPIVGEHVGSVFGRLRFQGGPRPGERAPDASPLQRANGSTIRLFDLLRGGKHVLLLFP